MIRCTTKLTLIAVHAVAIWPLAIHFYGGLSLACLAIVLLVVIFVASFFLTKWALITSSSANGKCVTTNGAPEDILPSVKSDQKLMHRENLESEITLLADIFQNELVTPCFSVICPDEKYSREVKAIFEDTLFSILNTVRMRVTPNKLFTVLLHLYTDHYKKFFNALKLSKNAKPTWKLLVELLGEKEIEYTPTHPALKNENELKNYCKKFVQAVLSLHMPEEVSNCIVVVLIVRDLLTDWLFQYLSGELCEPHYLSEIIFSLFIKDAQANVKETHSNHTTDTVQLQIKKEEAAASEMEKPDIKSNTFIGNVKCDYGNKGDEALTPIKSNDIKPIIEEGKIHRTVETSNGLNDTSTQQLPDGMPRLQKNNMRPAYEGLFQYHSVYNDCIQLAHPETRLHRSCSYESVLCSHQIHFKSFIGSHVFSANNIFSSFNDFPNIEQKQAKPLSSTRECKTEGNTKSIIKSDAVISNSQVFSEKEDIHRSTIIPKQLPLSTNNRQSLSGSVSDNLELSPIYEESEDLASSIAKLRSLLTEKQNHHSLGSQSSFGSNESEPKSAQSDPGRYNLEKQRLNFFHKDSSSSLASVKSFSSTESYSQLATEDEFDSDVPVDGRIFVNISIPSFETRSEPNGVQYIWYSIYYDAIYTYELVPEASNFDTSSQNETKVVLQTNIVKRRFCDFLDLHSSMESRSTLKNALKGIKSPNKWSNLSLSKQDSKSSKIHLEKYLQSLIQRAELNISTPLREFLAYGSEFANVCPRKPLEISSSRLDQFLARKVSGVIHSLRTALPSLESMDSTSDSPPSFGFGKKSNEKIVEDVTFDLSEFNDLPLDVTAEENICITEELLKTSIRDELQNVNIESATENTYSYERKNFSEVSPGIQTMNAYKKSSIASVCNTINEDHFMKTCDYEDNLLQNTFDSFAEIISLMESPWKVDMLFDMVSRYMGGSLKLIIQAELDKLCSEESIRNIFDRIRHAMKGNNCKQTTFDMRCSSLQLVKDRLFSSIPKSMIILFGSDFLEELTNLIVGSFACAKINQDFLLHLLDVIFMQLTVIGT